MERSDAHFVPEATIYTKNLLDAKEYLRTKIEALSLSEIERTYQKLTQALLFNSYVISNDIDVFVAFETMNNRGKPLSVLELLKNRLIYLSTKLHDSQQERGKLRAIINECWKTAYHFLGRNDETVVDDDVFLKRHYILYFGAREMVGRAATPDDGDTSGAFDVMKRDYEEFLLEEHFIVKNVREPTAKPPLNLKALYEYAHSIKAYVSIHSQIINPLDSSYTKEEKRILSQISRIVTDNIGEGFNLLLLAIYTSGQRVTAANRVKALRLIENILFIGSLGWWRLDEMKIFDAYAFAIKLAARAIDIPDLIRGLEKWIQERDQKIQPRKLIGWWAQKPFGFYGWRSIMYFMFEYEQKLREASKSDREKLHWKEFVSERRGRDYVSVEHILPQQVNNEYWKARVKDFSVPQRNMLKHTIGNLMPVSQPKNSSLSNKPFPEKKSMTGSTVGYAYGCYSEIEVAQESDWTARHIVERSVRLLTFLEQRWGIPLGTTKEKINMLGLQFVE